MSEINQPTDRIKQFFSYLLVGGAATVVEWVFFWLFGLVNFHYQLATVLAIVISTYSNWLFGRLWTFKDSEKGNVLWEIGQVYLAGIVGLLLNMLLMWIFVDGIHMPTWIAGWWDGKLAAFSEMIPKMIATAIVFAYNYLVRILVIYRKKKAE